MQNNSMEVLAPEISTDVSIKPNVLMGSTNDPISDNYTVIFIAVAAFSILYLILWYCCLKCCCFSISHCFENKLMVRGQIVHAAPQLPNISAPHFQNHHTTSDLSPLMMSQDYVSPHFQSSPPFPPPPPRYEEIRVHSSYQHRYQDSSPYPSPNQQHSTVVETNDRTRNSPPPPYEEFLKI